MTLNLEYWEEKISFLDDFLKWLENEEKTMICSFFKFSVLKHFWSLKLIDRVDFRVLLMFYSFQVIWVDLNDEFEKWTKYSKKLINTEISRHLIWWYFCLFFLMIDWYWLPPPDTFSYMTVFTRDRVWKWNLQQKQGQYRILSKNVKGWVLANLTYTISNWQIWVLIGKSNLWWIIIAMG